MSDIQQYVTFTLDGALFGLSVEHVREVLGPQPQTPTPLVPAPVVGLVNLRGQVVVALDTRAALALPPAPQGSTRQVVVADTPHETLALLVDEIGAVINVDSSTLDPAPHTLTGPVRDALLGVRQLDGQLLLVVDLDRLTQPTSV